MRRIAERLCIGAPSVYKHLPDKAALEAALISAGFEELSERFEAAAAGGGRPLPRERLAAGVEDRAARPLLEATGGYRDAARAAWPSPTG
jgi:AcrR family transcriptional regulator